MRPGVLLSGVDPEIEAGGIRHGISFNGDGTLPYRAGRRCLAQAVPIVCPIHTARIGPMHADGNAG